MVPEMTVIAAVATFIQKATFVIYIVVSLWTGSLTAYFKVPNKWFFAKWLKSLLRKVVEVHLDGCDSFWGILSNPGCIRDVVFKEEAEVYEPLMSMSESSKWQYILIIKTLQLVAPYVFIVSLLLVPICGFMLLSNIVRKTLRYFGQDNVWEMMRAKFLRLTHGVRLYSRKLENVMCVCLGFVVFSFLVCFFHPLEDFQESCTTPSCLYCWPRLLKTMFQELHQDPNYNSLGIASRFTLQAMMVVSTFVFESLLFMSTVLFLCVMVYLTLDALRSLRNIWRSVKKYFGPQLTGYNFRLAWNRWFTSLKRIKPPSLEDNVMPTEGAGDEKR